MTRRSVGTPAVSTMLCWFNCSATTDTVAWSVRW